MIKYFLLLALIPFAIFAESRVINNELKLHWPEELVYMDFPAGSMKGKSSVELKSVVYQKGEYEHDMWLRPIQLEQLTVKGKELDRVWYKASLKGASYKDSKGRVKKSPAPYKANIEFGNKKTSAGISMKASGDYYLINNGVYEFRLRKYSKFSQPVPMNKLKHFIAGMRPVGSKVWDGKAFFEGTSEVHSVKTEILNSGPVYIDVKLTFDYASPNLGETDSVKLMLGKQAHTYEANVIPREKLVKKEKYYEVALRFVANDPWIEVVERARLPKDPKVSGWGIHQYYILWGKTDKVPEEVNDIPNDKYVDINTVSWVRWFFYDQFGGNSHQQTVEAKPRPDQKGRPFALLRPKWNQGGGGAQDFVLTTGGKLSEKPAFGVVASFASKWSNISTIAAYVRTNQKGVRVPLTSGPAAKNYYMTRSYALLCGPGIEFTNLNSVVRRHTDWTLTAQINKYILTWKRNSALAGANIMTNKKRLAELQKMAKAGKLESIQDKIKEIKKMSRQIADLKDIANAYKIKEQQAKDLYFEAKKIKKKDPAKAKSLDEQAKFLKETAKKERSSPSTKEAEGKVKSLERKTKGTDYQIISLLLGNPVNTPRLPTPSMYLNTRYQDDANNPTNYGNRRMVNGPFPLADLLSAEKAFGGPQQAAIGYIYSDLDAWPGWHNEWNPGNPNFHTDKYIASIYAAAAMQDHPHAKEWLKFGLNNFNSDLKKVFIAPDGVGAECPGYAGFSMSLQLETGGAIFNSGLGNPFVANPLIKKNAIWHRKLITPYDKRIKRRHEAPIGDTHRWDSGMGKGFAHLAPFYKKDDPSFASELVTTYKLLKDSGASLKSHGLQEIFLSDSSIKTVKPESLDWSSEYFYGFGALMRNNFGTERESFLSFKAGPTHGHYHNDELSWHFYSGGTPISLDYNCSYHPREDHAALHNTSTFGNSDKIKHNGAKGMVEAMEQAFSSARVGAFVSTPKADLIVAERVTSGLSLSPIDPHNAEFQRKYPYRKTETLVHRRSLVFVKHEENSPFEDYIVVREDFKNSKEKQQINLHLLGREIIQNGNDFFIPGQYEKDIQVFLSSAKDLKVDKRHWEYFDEWTKVPSEYAINKGESLADYDKRMEKLAKDNGQKTLPLKDWKMSYTNRDGLKENMKVWHDKAHATEGRVLMPPKNWNSSWTYGENQQWLRLETAPGSSMLYIIYPHKPGKRAKLSGDENSITVEVNGQKEIVFINDGVRISDNGKESELLKSGTLKDLGQLSLNAEDTIRIKK